MKQNILLLLAVAAGSLACAQKPDAGIPLAEVRRIETILAADSMQGRKAGAPGAEKAAAFIAAEFQKAGLQPLSGNSFLQSFTMVRPQLVAASGKVNDRQLQSGQIIAVTQQPQLNVTETSGYQIESIKAGDNIGARVQEIMGSPQSAVVFVDSAFANLFPRLAGFQQPFFKNDSARAGKNVVFVLGSQQLGAFALQATHRLEEAKFANVAGVLPGKSKAGEQVIFSAHYDHLGIGKAVQGDSVYNGANDDASGTTAVILLASHFKKLANNERTLVFAAFTAEEIGGFGSQYFSQQLNPQQVMAMFNIEMIGTESKWGRNSAYITGYEKTDMGKILQQNLQGSSFAFHPDPYPDQQLFYRSDNATLARLGVPAHTISTSKMDSEKYYHTPDDEVETLDLENMAQIIKAIAVSSTSVISGKDTPSRVKPESLH